MFQNIARYGTFPLGMKKLVLLFALLTVALFSCRKEVPVATEGVQLKFSKETIRLDTVFRTVGSSTYRLVVRNPKDENVIIDNISLDVDPGCISLNVNGIASNSISDVEILANDSIHIFIKTTQTLKCRDASQPDTISRPNHFTHTDFISFTNKDVKQTVKLITIVRDAYFHFPDKFIQIGGTTIPYSIIAPENQSVTLPNDKPHVVYGYAVADESSTLNIPGGTELYFHQGAGLWVFEGATLKVAEGAVSGIGDSVTFTADRLEPFYEDAPGQWGGALGGIFLQGKSGNHIINNAVIKNATIGLQLDSNTSSLTTLSNSYIMNCSRVGIYGGFGNLQAENVVVANSGLYCFYAFGGSYTFTNCTFANYWQGSTRSSGAVTLSNYLELVDENNRPYRIVRELNKADFYNCIIAGNNQEELSILEDEGKPLNYFLQYCMIDVFSDPEDRLYDVNDPLHFQNILLNKDPDFVNTEKNIYALDSLSQATNQGSISNQTAIDIIGYPRLDGQPDLGAYERKY